MRLIDADIADEIIAHAENEWNLAMAAADGNREINRVYKMHELCRAVRGVVKSLPTIELKPRYIPVEERQPEHYRNEDGSLIPFIVCVRNCKYPVVAYYNAQIWGGMGRMDVVAWAPTPEPHKDDEHD